MNAQYLLLAEIALKLGVGLPLLIAPRLLSRVMGFPVPSDDFWPRMLGGLLAGLGLAAGLESQYLPGKVISLYGLSAVNLASAVVLAGLLILGFAGTTKRGRTTLWLTFAALSIVAFMEIVSTN